MEPFVPAPSTSKLSKALRRLELGQGIHYKLQGQEWSPGLGELAQLPLEIRRLIYALLLVARPGARSSWGRGSGITSCILRTSRSVLNEALPLLYDAKHIIKCSSALPPVRALSRAARIEFEICFKTINRADYEESIVAADDLYAICDRVGLSLRHNTVLQELSISLLNSNQRKRGPKPLRSEAVRATMRRMLLPFATLPATLDIRITGFDFLEWIELFAQLREKYSDSELPLEMLLE